MPSELGLIYSVGRNWTGSMVDLSYNRNFGLDNFPISFTPQSSPIEYTNSASKSGLFYPVKSEILRALRLYKSFPVHYIDGRRNNISLVTTRCLLEILREKSKIRHSLTSLMPVDDANTNPDSISSRERISSRAFRSHSCERETGKRKQYLSPGRKMSDVKIRRIRQAKNAISCLESLCLEGHGLQNRMKSNKLSNSNASFLARKRFFNSDGDIAYTITDENERISSITANNSFVECHMKDKVEQNWNYGDENCNSEVDTEDDSLSLNVDPEQYERLDNDLSDEEMELLFHENDDRNFFTDNTIIYQKENKADFSTTCNFASEFDNERNISPLLEDQISDYSTLDNEIVDEAYHYPINRKEGNILCENNSQSNNAVADVLSTYEKTLNYEENSVIFDNFENSQLFDSNMGKENIEQRNPIELNIREQISPISIAPLTRTNDSEVNEISEMNTNQSKSFHTFEEFVPAASVNAEFVAKRHKSVRFADEVGHELAEERVISDLSMPPVIRRTRLDSFDDDYREVGNGLFRSRAEETMASRNSNISSIFPPPVPKDSEDDLIGKNKCLSEIPTEFAWRPTFTQPAAQYLAFRRRLESINVSLENVSISTNENDPDILTLYGTIKVKKVAPKKTVKLRVTSDNWASFKDYPATHSDELSSAFGSLYQYDVFMFNFTIDFTEKNKPHISAFTGEQQQQLQFAVCFEAVDEMNCLEYWDNNDGCNYIVVKEVQKKLFVVHSDSNMLIAGRENSRSRCTIPTDEDNSNDANKDALFPTSMFTRSKASKNVFPQESGKSISLNIKAPYSKEFISNFDDFKSMTNYSSLQIFSTEAMYY